METIFSRYNPWWEKGYRFTTFFERKKDVDFLKSQLKNSQIVFITGLRRVGKTTLMKLMIQHLISQKGVNPAHVFYLSMDEYLLSHIDIITIVEEYRKTMRLKFREKLYLFFDEITYKKDFDIQLKNLFDTHHVKIFASSSSSSLMKERKTALTGRHILFELLPLNFNEYLLFKKIKVSKEDSHLLPGYFHQFLVTGGIPDYVIRNEKEFIRDLVDDIIYKDIAAVNGIKNVQILKDFFLLLMERSAKIISINKMAQILKISPDTSKRYLDLFESTFLIYLVGKFGKPNETLLSPRKLYAADNGIRTLFTGERDFGSLFESYVFQQIKEFKPQYLYDSSTEIDFYIKNQCLIEAKYHDEALSEKQQKLFDTIKIKNKFIIRNHLDINNVVSDLKKERK